MRNRKSLCINIYEKKFFYIFCFTFLYNEIMFNGQFLHLGITLSTGYPTGTDQSHLLLIKLTNPC